MKNDWSPTGAMLEARGAYRRWLHKRFRHFSLAGLVADDEPILLKQIYVPLRLSKERIADSAGEDEVVRGTAPAAKWLERVLAGDPTLAIQPIREHIVCVAGEAGSGKTTLTQHIVCSLAEASSDPISKLLREHIVIPIQLRYEAIDSIQSLDDLIRTWLRRANKEDPEIEPQALEAFLDAGRAIVILDGLDELGHFERREMVMRWLRGHRWTVRDAGRGANLFIVTARPTGLVGLDESVLAGIVRLNVAPFSRDQIREFLQKWFELRPLPPARRAEQVRTLVDRLVGAEENQQLQLASLARRPAYLASLAFVHGTRGALPYTRAALYDTVIEAYIDTLDRQRGIQLPPWDRQEKRDVLATIAFQAQVGKGGGEGSRTDRRYSWTLSELKQGVRSAIERGQPRFRSLRPDDADNLAEYYVARTGLLTESREGVFQFGHLSFQEYLAAQYAIDRAAGSNSRPVAFERLLLQRLSSPGWDEVTLLALAIDAARTRGVGHRALLSRLKYNEPEHIDLLGRILAGDEIPLERDEREAWTTCWLLAASLYRRSWPDRVRVVSPNAAETLQAVWEPCIRAEADLREPFLVAIERLEKICQTTPSSRGEEFDAEIAEPLEGPRSWLEKLRDAVVVTTTLQRANLLASGFTFGLTVPVELALAVAKQLLAAEGRPGSDSPLFDFVCHLSVHFNIVRQLAVRATPLIRVVFDDDFTRSPAADTRWKGERGEALVKWRTRAWRRTLRVRHEVLNALTGPTGSDSASVKWCDLQRRRRQESRRYFWGIQKTPDIQGPESLAAIAIFILRESYSDPVNAWLLDQLGALVAEYLRRVGIINIDQASALLNSFGQRSLRRPPEYRAAASAEEVRLARRTLLLTDLLFTQSQVRAAKRSKHSWSSLIDWPEGIPDAAIAGADIEQARLEWAELDASIWSPRKEVGVVTEIAREPRALRGVPALIGELLSAVDELSALRARQADS